MKELTELLTEYEDTKNMEQNEFNDFTPFENAAPLPEFPFGELALVIYDLIDYVCVIEQSVQAPFDLVGPCVLGVLEIACRGRFPVRLPSGHIERPCLYIAPIAPPSERKSGVIEAVTRPLREFENEYNRQNSGSASEIKLLQGKITKAEREAINGKTIDERLRAEAELESLIGRLDEAQKRLRLMGADVTPEKLADLMKSQDGVFALVSAEGGGLFENIGRYSDKGGLEIYLNGYSGDMISVDRKSSETVVIDSPTLSIIAPCQPSVIYDLFSDAQKSGRGLLSRILFVRCMSYVGTRKATSSPPPPQFIENYRTLCRNILSSEEKGDLTFDEAAFAVYSAFFDEIEKKLTPDVGELSFMSEWAGKLHGQMARLSGLIHCIAAFSESRSPLSTPINAAEASAAVSLARYFLAHAKAVYIGQAEPREISNAKYLWARLNSFKSGKISKKDLTRKVQDKKDFDYSESLQTLINKGYIRIETIIQPKGRPIENIIINPEAVKKH